MGIGFFALALHLSATLDAVIADPPPPLVQLQGQPYAAGEMSLHVTARSSVGKWTLLVYGAHRLSLPVPTSGGLLYVGGPKAFFNLGPMPPSEQLAAEFRMPDPLPAGVGAAIVLQGVVGGQLSNPTMLPLDEPYYLPAQAQVLASPHPVEFSLFGDRLAAGDLNDDGAQDLIVGAWFEDAPGLAFVGRAYVLWGPDFASSLTLASPEPKAFGFFGTGLAAADFDGDGVDDLVVSESRGTSASAPGHLYVYRGGGELSATPSFSVTSTGVGAAEASGYGRFRAIGDLNGDALPDLALGVASATVDGLAQAGRIDIFWAPAFAEHTELTSPTPQASAFFGSALAIGDVNGDGLADLVEGSGRADVDGLENAGRVHVFRGGSLELLLTLADPLTPSAHARFGEALHVADLDLDSRAEIVVADQLEHVFLFRATDGGFANPVASLSKPPSPVQSVDFALHIDSGDVNGDGHGDLILGDAFDGFWPPRHPPGSTLGTGMLRIALGPDYATFHNLYDSQPQPEDAFGMHFLARDFDGDGRPELIAGAAFADAGGVPDSGHVAIFSTPASAPTLP